MRTYSASVASTPGDRFVAHGERRGDRAVFAQRDRQRARVDADDRRDRLLLEPRTEIDRVLEVRRPAREMFDHAAGDRRVRMLRHRTRDAVVADQRIGERQDLSGVRRIGERFLIAGHAGVKDGLAERRRVRAETIAFETGAVGE